MSNKGTKIFNLRHHHALFLNSELILNGRPLTIKNGKNLWKCRRLLKLFCHKAQVTRKLMKECAQNFFWGENRKWLLCQENSRKFSRQLNCGIAIYFKFEIVRSLNIARNKDFCQNILMWQLCAAMMSWVRRWIEFY